MSSEGSRSSPDKTMIFKNFYRKTRTSISKASTKNQRDTLSVNPSFPFANFCFFHFSKVQKFGIC